MTSQPGHERSGDTVPHQDEIEELIEVSQSLKLVGPYFLNFDDDPDTAPGASWDNWVKVADLPEGTVVIAASAITEIPIDASTDSLWQIGIAEGAGSRGEVQTAPINASGGSTNVGLGIFPSN